MSKLYVLATPLGNLADISSRFKDVVGQLDLLACEDTRQTGKLLSLLGINSPKLISYHEHNEASRTQQLIDKMRNETINVGIVSDAGTPAISDPGARLVEAAHKGKIQVIPVPGPCSFVSLYSASGLRSTSLYFAGFLPRKKSEKLTTIQSWATIPAPVIIYESAERVISTLSIISQEYPKSECCFGRELTKKFETIVKDKTCDLLESLATSETLKGECTLIFCLHADSEITKEELFKKIHQEMQSGTSTKEISKRLASDKFSKNDIYQFCLDIKAES